MRALEWTIVSGVFGRTHVKTALLCAASILSLGTAYAQNVNGPNTSTKLTNDPTETVTVTARHRSEQIKDVPMAIFAFGSAKLQEKAAVTLQDLAHSFPATQYSERGNSQTELTIRGIGGDARNVGIESGVGMYVDGVYIARSSGYNIDLADIERVEVLQGPQGTLFGKNQIAGVLNITTKKPSDQRVGNLDISYGNYSAIRTQASLSGAVADGVDAKATFFTWNRDGYLYNVYDKRRYNDEDRLGGRVQFRFNPTANLEINLRADASRDRSGTVNNQMGSAAGSAAPYYNGNRFQINSDQKNSIDRDMVGTSLTIDYKLPNDATLTSISAYRKINILVYSDIDQTPLNTFNSGPFTDDSIAYSQELRFVSSASERLRHVAGLFYLNHDNGGIRYIYIGGSLANGIFNDASTKTNSYAAYVNEEFDILRDLTVAGGLRYTDEQKDGHFIQVRPNLSYNFPSLNREDTNVSWLGSLRYKLTPEITTYFTASKGFKSGGFNLDSLAAVRLTAQDLNFRPESVVNYEIGIKGSMFDRKLNFSAAAFNMDYTDKQVSQFVSTVLATTPSVQVTNAGTAQIKGAQLELSALVSDRLTVSGNIAYVDAKYTSFPNAATVAGKLIAYTGNRIERTPDTTASIGAQYTYPLPAGNLVVNGSANYTGNHFLQPDNLAYGYQKGYTLYDARVGYESNQGWSAYFWGKNIGNKSYTVYGRIFAGLNQVVFGDPRFFGIEAKYSF